MIRTILKYVLLAVLGVVIQSIFAKSGFYCPDLLLVIAVLLAFTSQNASGLLGAFSLGLLSDLASGVYLGPFAAGYVCAFCFAGAISRRVFADRPLAVIGVTFLASIVKSVVFSSFVLYFVNSSPASFLNLKIFLIEAIITALISPVVFRIFTGKLPGKFSSKGKSSSRGMTSSSFSRAN